MEKGARGRSTRARARERERETGEGRRVRHASKYIRVHTSASARTNTWIHTATHGTRMRALASLVPFKNPRSYRVSVLLYHSSPLPPPVRRAAPRAFPTLKDVTSCNADQRGRARVSEAIARSGRRSRLQQPRCGSLLDCNSIKA